MGNKIKFNTWLCKLIILTKKNFFKILLLIDQKNMEYAGTDFSYGTFGKTDLRTSK